MKRALLLSGGMDSTAIAWWKRPDIAITIDYGQMCAAAELEASKAICSVLQIEHVEVAINCRALGSGDMAAAKPNGVAPESDWWPYRNQMLITFAAMKAIAMEADVLWIGCVSTDQGHADGSVEFVRRIDELLSMQEGGIRVEAPAITMTTEELIRVAGIPPETLAWAHSCHKATVACGDCRGCNKYFDVYAKLGYDLGRTG
jgi:7-cyano-7-deazaguanine synthase